MYLKCINNFSLIDVLYITEAFKLVWFNKFTQIYQSTKFWND